jgi:hypothetical protein
MKTDIRPFRFHSLGLAALLSLTLLPLARAQAPTQAPGAPKVRVFVRENDGATVPGGATAATPAPSKAGKAGAGAAAGATQATSAEDAMNYTRTTRKSLSVDVVNITAAPMDVVVKSNFLAKDEAGTHGMVTEKTLENKLSLAPGKTERFTTEEVPFTHTAAHLGPKPKAAAGASAKGRGPVSKMEPASGHAYFGYKVDVFQGGDLVGSAVSDSH